MAALRFSFILLIFVASLHVFVTGAAINIKLDPDVKIDAMTWEIQVSCMPKPVNSTVEIILLEVTKDDQEPIALIRQNNKISYGSQITKQSKIEANGHVSSNISDSYLNVIIPYPSMNDTGNYKCIMYFLDATKQFNKISAAKQLFWDKPDINSLEKALKNIAKKVNILQEEQKAGRTACNSSDILERLIKLEKKAQQEQLGLGISDELKGMDSKITSLEKRLEKDNVMSAFSATSMGAIPVKTGETIVFGYAQTNIGNNYDKATGIYTAPIDGLYSFSVVLTAPCSENCKAEFELTVNGQKKMVIITASLKNFSRAASGSILLVLKTGDKVQVKTSFLTGRTVFLSMSGKKRAFYSGYLVSAM